MMSRSECIRGCVQVDVHFASCDDAVELGGSCTGCAPAPVLPGFVVCERCRRRMRGLLRIAPDLLGRMRALAAHGKAVVYSPVKVVTAAASAPDQVDPDIADALIEITANLRDWSRWIDPRTLDGVDALLADEVQTVRLSAAVLDSHSADADGVRHWSVVDAAARWGVERRGADRFVFSAAADEVQELIAPVPEPRHDPLLITRDAATEARVTERHFRRWVSKGEITPRATLRNGSGGTDRYFYRSEVLATARRMRDRGELTRFGGDRVDTPTSA